MAPAQVVNPLLITQQAPEGFGDGLTVPTIRPECFPRQRRPNVK
jgi:hypothetical protein